MSIGIIGLGQMGLLHAALQNSLPNKKVVGMCDSDSRIIKIAKKILPDIHFYDNYSEMLDDQVLDAIVVCTPPYTHLEVLLDLGKRIEDKGILVEKPLTDTYENSLRVLEAFKGSSNVKMVGYQKRHLPTFRKAKEFLDHSLLGELSFYRSHYYSAQNIGGASPKLEEKGMDVVLDFSPHIIDLMLWFFGEPSSIESVARRMTSNKVNDYLHSVWAFENGLVGYLDSCWSMRGYTPPELSIEAHGEKGTLNVTEDRLILHLDKDVPGLMPAGVHMLHASSLMPSLPFLLSYPEYMLSDMYFLNCVEHNYNAETDFETSAKVDKIIGDLRKAKTRGSQ